MRDQKFPLDSTRIHTEADLWTEDKGWIAFKTAHADAKLLAANIERFGWLVGNPTRGRTGKLVEPVVPMAANTAWPRSLSNLYGTGELPLHTDTAHNLQPCRWLLLACAEPGSEQTTTRILDCHSLRLSTKDRAVLETAPFFVRTGRKSFYTTILDKTRPFVRYDPGCMEPVNQSGRLAISILQQAIGKAEVEEHAWCRGDVILLDNWRVMHGRGDARTCEGRLLLRIAAA